VRGGLRRAVTATARDSSLAASEPGERASRPSEPRCRGEHRAPPAHEARRTRASGGPRQRADGRERKPERTGAKSRRPQASTRLAGAQPGGGVSPRWNWFGALDVARGTAKQSARRGRPHWSGARPWRRRGEASAGPGEGRGARSPVRAARRHGFGHEAVASGAEGVAAPGRAEASPRRRNGSAERKGGRTRLAVCARIFKRPPPCRGSETPSERSERWRWDGATNGSGHTGTAGAATLGGRRRGSGSPSERSERRRCHPRDISPRARRGAS